MSLSELLAFFSHFGWNTNGLILARHFWYEAHTGSESKDMWQWIDTDKSGSVTIPEFFEGFELLNEPFQQKSLGRR